MTRPSPEPILPVEETLHPKTEVLDWQRIDTTATYALEYRTNVVFLIRAHFRTIALLVVTSVMAVPIAWGLGRLTGERLWRWECAVAATLLGLILAAGNQLAQIRRPESNGLTVDATTLLCLLAPPFGWLAAALTSHLLDLAGAFLYLAVAVPMLVVAADRIATHSIHWMTANRLVDYATLIEWRRDWAWRFLRAPRLELTKEEAANPQLIEVFNAVVCARANYAIGLLWILAGVVLPTAFILIGGRPPNLNTIGLQLVVGVVFGILIAGIMRTGGQLTTVSRFWYALTHWLHHGKNTETVPWMFQSPCGDFRRRRLATIAAAGLLSVALTSLALHSVAHLTSADTAGSVMRRSVRASESVDNLDAAPSTEQTGIPTWLAVGSSVPAIILFSATIPPVVFLLTLWILIGPTIHAYYQALEQ